MYITLPLLAILSLIPLVFSDATPLVIPWNTTHSYGPDGPWPVVTVQVGSNGAAGDQPLSTVDLYPGGIWQSIILRRDFCNTNGTNSADGSTPCLAEKAGTYYLAGSETVKQNVTDAVGLIWEWSSSAADSESGLAVNVMDTMTIPALQGDFTVQNSTISAVSAWQIQLPDGTKYSAQVGTLSLGGPGQGIQEFSATTNGQTIPGFAYAQGDVASNSWGLHYGSASLNQEGSLVFGGYDQSRILGDVGVFETGVGTRMVPNLLDVQIGVETGSSPFSEASYTGLLKLNTSFNGVQPAVINPIIPYLYMSPETCAAVTENLPVTLDSQVGLYIWNTTDPQYQRIVSSPAYLAFVFQNAGGGNITIKVPFQLLNLTLEAPIVTIAQQYFPCRPFHAFDGSGDYFLGRAFLQAAFIGMNWQEETFFLAQAPGPGVGASKIISIGPDDTTIGNDPIENFAVTWARNWTPLSDTNNSANTTAPSTNTTNGQKDTGLSSGTKAGIAVAVVVGALAVAGLVLLYCLRRRRRRIVVPLQEPDMSRKRFSWIPERERQPRLHELNGEGLLPEADANHEIHELHELDVRTGT